MQEIIKKLFTQQVIQDKQYKRITQGATNLLIQQPNVIKLSPPFLVYGDMYGSISSAKSILAKLRQGNKVLLLGNYVNFGKNSLQTIAVLFAAKSLYPKQMFMLRGGMQSQKISFHNGFFQECNRKTGTSCVWRQFCQLFALLPIAAICPQLYFVSSGIAESYEQIDIIRMLKRNIMSPETNDYLCQLMWNQPTDEPNTWQPTKRGYGKYYDRRTLMSFMRVNGIGTMVRGHEIVRGAKSRWNQSLITIYSGIGTFPIKEVCYGQIGSEGNISLKELNSDSPFKP